MPRAVTYSERQKRQRHRKRLMREQRGRCYFCAVEMSEPVPQSRHALHTATIEHYPVKWADGGCTVVGNVVAACHACNAGRNTAEQCAVTSPPHTPA